MSLSSYIWCNSNGTHQDIFSTDFPYVICFPLSAPDSQLICTALILKYHFQSHPPPTKAIMNQVIRNFRPVCATKKTNRYQQVTFRPKSFPCFFPCEELDKKAFKNAFDPKRPEASPRASPTPRTPRTPRSRTSTNESTGRWDVKQKKKKDGLQTKV